MAKINYEQLLNRIYLKLKLQSLKYIISVI